MRRLTKTNTTNRSMHPTKGLWSYEGVGNAWKEKRRSFYMKHETSWKTSEQCAWFAFVVVFALLTLVALLWHWLALSLSPTRSLSLSLTWGWGTSVGGRQVAKSGKSVASCQSNKRLLYWSHASNTRTKTKIIYWSVFQKDIKGFTEYIAHGVYSIQSKFWVPISC